MKVSVIDGSADTATVVLDGKLDIAGAGVVEHPLAQLAETKKSVIIDMSSVSFLASLGIRHLVTTARALSRKGGRVVLLSPTAMVEEVLRTSGVVEMMTLARSQSEANSAVGTG